MKLKLFALALAFVLFALSLMASPSPNTGSVFAYFTFPPPQPLGFVTYNLYYGTTSSNYTQSLPTGSSTNATVTGLTRGQTYYFNVTQTATNQVSGEIVESDYSTEVTITIANKPPRATSLIISGH